MRPPLITVITVALNAEDHIEQTIKSVLGQTWRPVEYIIVEGGSTDDTLRIVERYKDHLTHVVSEKDEGIADAMNKGFALAGGDYIAFLHADDYFKNDNSLEDAIGFLEETTDILTCSIQFGKQLRLYRPRGFNFWFYFKTGIFHQGTLCRRSLIEELGGFDKQFQIVMDYDFFLRAYRKAARLVKAPVVLSVMRDLGVSTRPEWEFIKLRLDEERKVHEKNCPSMLMLFMYKIYWSLYMPYRQLAYVLKNSRRH